MKQPGSVRNFLSDRAPAVPKVFSLSAIALFAIIVLLPIFYMILAPFLSEGFGHLNDISFFDNRHLTLSKNSLGLAAGTTFFCLVIGIPLAFLFYKTDLWGRRIFSVLYIIPILIPPYIQAITWCHLSDFLRYFLLLDIHSLGGAIFVLTLSYFPFVTLMTLSGLKVIDRNLEEASLLYRGRLCTLRHITLPLVTPYILSGAMFVFIFSIVDFGVPDILRVNVYPVEIFIQFSAFYNERVATILSLPLIVITLFLIFLQKWHMKDRSYIQMSGGYSKATPFHLRWFNIPTFCFCFSLIGLSVVLPISVLFKIAGPISNYLRVLSTSLDQIEYSLLLASSGAFITLILAFSLSYIIEKSNTGTKIPLSFLTVMPLAISATTLGIGLIKVWNRPVADYVYGSSLIIIIGYIARFMPFSEITIASGLKQISPRLEEVASLITPKWKRIIQRIVIPLLRHSLITGFLIVFILSFGELGTTLLIIPPGRETIPIKIYNLMHYGADQMVAALCLILIAIILAFSGLFLVLYKKSEKKIM